ncbi:MAG: WD40 repeat domain-containing protein [Chloroflexi bacterium]|nr:WD40 repeat domain-containing protein [Chloroflexota bacterium]
MNDDFLHKHRQAPSKAFADKLYRQLQEENEDMTALPMTRTYARRARFPVGAAALFALLLVGVLLALRPTFTPPTLTQIDTGFLNALQPITSENASDLTQIAQLGRGRVFDVDWHGDMIAVGGALGVWLYDSTHLTEAPRLLPAQQTMYARRVALTWSRTNPLVAAPDGDTIRVWNAETGEEVGAFSDGDDKHWDVVAISPDGRYVAGGENMLGYEVTQRWALNVWEVETGEITFIRNLQNPILNLDFNPLRLYQFAAQTFGGTWVFNAEENDFAGISYPQSPATNLDVGLDYSPNGETLAFGTENGVLIWNVETRQVEQEIIINADLTPYVTDVAFSADGAYLAIASRNFGVNLWNVLLQSWITGEPDHLDHEGFQDVSALVFNNALRSSLLASVQLGSTLSVFSFGTGMTLTNQRDFTAPIMRADLNADNRTIAAGGMDGYIDVWNLETGREVYAVNSELANLTDLAFTPDGSLLAYSGRLGRIQAGVSGEREPGRTLVNRRGGVSLLNAETGEYVRRLGDLEDYFYLFAFSPDGETLAAYDGFDNNVKTWNWETADESSAGEALFTSPVSIDRLGYSADGSLITVTSFNNDLAFYDAVTGDQQTPFETPIPRVIDVAYSPDGSRMVVAQRLATYTSYITLHDVEAGAMLFPLQYTTNTDLVTNLTFSPDGALIAAIVDENRVHVWDAATGALLFDHGDEYIPNNQLMFSRDGRMIVTADWDGLIRIWGIPE